MKKEELVINWLLICLEKEGLLSKKAADMTFHRYKKLYKQEQNETGDNDYTKVA